MISDKTKAAEKAINEVVIDATRSDQDTINDLEHLRDHIDDQLRELVQDLNEEREEDCD